MFSMFTPNGRACHSIGCPWVDRILLAFVTTSESPNQRPWSLPQHGEGYQTLILPINLQNLHEPGNQTISPATPQRRLDKEITI